MSIIDNKVENAACLRDNNKYSYARIGGTTNGKMVCYKYFGNDATCDYLKIKNNRQFCTRYDKN
jgi:hypothetical protein